MHLDLWSDGNLKPSPSAGVVIKRDGVTIVSDGVELLPGSTNNEAEHSAVLLGLYNCIKLGAKTVKVHADSQLIVNQCAGRWACTKPHLQVYLDELRELVAQLDSVEWQWIPREENEEADAASRAACK